MPPKKSRGRKNPDAIVRIVQGGGYQEAFTALHSHNQVKHFKRKLVNSGLVKAILQNLQNPQTSSQVQNSVSLLFWIQCLCKLLYCEDLSSHLREAIRLEISHNLGPLFAVMLDTAKRTLFGDQRSWYEGTCHFVRLLSYLTKSKETIPILLKHGEHGDLRKYLVQVLFCNHQHNQELKLGLLEVDQNSRYRYYESGTLIALQYQAAETIWNVFCTFDEDSGDIETKAALQELADTPVAPGSSETLGKCILNAVEEAPPELLNRLLEIVFIMRTELGPRPLICSHNNHGIEAGDDKDFLQRTVVMAQNHSATSPETTTEACLLAISRAMDPAPDTTDEYFLRCDTLAACAVELNVVELALDCLIRCGEPGLEDTVADLIEKIHSVVLCERTNKALCKQKCALIEEKMNQSSVNETYGVVANSLNKLLFVARSTKMESRYYSCFCCSNEIGIHGARYCAGCERAIYCSKECQAKHWKRPKECQEDHWKHGEHRLVCKSFQSIDAEKTKERLQLDKNLATAAGALILNFNNNVLVQAEFLELDILECCVLVDFSLSNIFVQSKVSVFEHIDGLLHEPEQQELIREIFERNRLDESLSALCLADNGNGGWFVLPLSLPSTLAPTVRNPGVSDEPMWTAAQKQAVSEWGEPEEFDRVRNDQDLFEDTMEKLSETATVVA